MSERLTDNTAIKKKSHYVIFIKGLIRLNIRPDIIKKERKEKKKKDFFTMFFLQKDKYKIMHTSHLSN